MPEDYSIKGTRQDSQLQFFLETGAQSEAINQDGHSSKLEELSLRIRSFREEMAPPCMNKKRKTVIALMCFACELAIMAVLSSLQNDAVQVATAATRMRFMRQMQMMIQASLAKRRRIEHEWWVKPRPLSWFEDFVARSITDKALFSGLFRMSPTTFEWLVLELSPFVVKINTNFRFSIPPLKRIAIGLFRLATGTTYLFISEKFAVGEATVLVCTQQLCRALRMRFGAVLTYPQGDDLKRITSGFQSIAGLPNCCGAIDCIHFVIKRPIGEGAFDYRNSKKQFTIATQVIVDSSMRILHLATGFPGSMTDAQVFRMCKLQEKVRRGEILSGRPVLACRVSIPEFIVGDTRYPPLPWLITSYKGIDLPVVNHNFNKKLVFIRQVVERAIVHLRRWGVLAKAMHVDVATAVDYVVSCSILHNLMLEKNEIDNDDISLGSVSFQNFSMSMESDFTENQDYETMQIRDALASELSGGVRVYG